MVFLRFYLVSQCPTGYSELVSGSDNCYKIIEDTVNFIRMTWEKAKDNCADDNAMLACFNTPNERDVIAQWCHDNNAGYGCWVGYQYVRDTGKLKCLIMTI